MSMKRADPTKLRELSKQLNSLAEMVIKTETERIESIKKTLEGVKKIREYESGLGTETIERPTT